MKDYMERESPSQSEKLVLNMLARLVGECQGPHTKHGWPYPEVHTDDDVTVRLPMTERGAAVIASARRLLAEHGMEPIAPRDLGS